MSTPAKAADGTDAPVVVATAAPTPPATPAAPVVVAAAPVVPVAPVPAVPAHIQASREAEAADLERCAANWYSSTNYCSNTGGAAGIVIIRYRSK